MNSQVARSWRIPCGPQTLELGQRTYIMGILNVTPDSFSDGGRFNDLDRAVARAKEMLAEGADIIDIGGESTRPGHTEVDAEEEIRRVIPVVRAIGQALPNAVMSVDTYKAQVAEAALEAGAHMINDVWGLQRDPDMARVVAQYQAPTVVMHNQDSTDYRDLMQDIVDALQRSIDAAVKAGLPSEFVIVDPGIGFGKTPVQNLDCMRDMSRLKVLGCPILLGTSRKSTIGKVLGGLPPGDRVEGTAATVAIGIANGADIVRVHDVKQMKRVAMMADAIVRPSRGGWNPD